MCKSNPVRARRNPLRHEVVLVEMRADEVHRVYAFYDTEESPDSSNLFNISVPKEKEFGATGVDIQSRNPVSVSSLIAALRFVRDNERLIDAWLPSREQPKEQETKQPAL